MDPRTINDSARLMAAVKNTALIGVSLFLCTFEAVSVNSRCGFSLTTYLAYPPRERKTLVSGEHICDSGCGRCKSYVTCSNENNERQENTHYDTIRNG